MGKYNKIDQKRRLVYANVEKKKIILKVLFSNFLINNYLRYYILFLFSKFTRNSSKSRLINRCYLTGRSKGVFRYLGLSRMMVKKHGGLRNIFGLRKVSW